MKKWIQKTLGITALGKDQDFEIGRRLNIESQISLLHEKLDNIQIIITSSFKPVILLTGSMLKTWGNEDKIEYTDYAWAIRPDNSQSIDDRIVFSCQPDCTIKLKHLEVLNGFYDITECKIDNMDMVASYPTGVFPKDVKIPLQDIVITPANRMYMVLRPRV